MKTPKKNPKPLTINFRINPGVFVFNTSDRKLIVCSLLEVYPYCKVGFSQPAKLKLELTLLGLCTRLLCFTDSSPQVWKLSRSLAGFYTLELGQEILAKLHGIRKELPAALPPNFPWLKMLVEKGPFDE
jgi:hypothetical protein